MSLKFKIIKSVPRKFIYTTKSVYNLKNILSLSRFEFDEEKTYNNELQKTQKDFLTFCKQNEISPFNFLDDKVNYILTTENTNKNIINLKETYGLSARFIIERNVDKLNFDDVYNFDCSNNILEYSYIQDQDTFIESLNKLIEEEQNIKLDQKDRETKHRLDSYVNCKIYDHNMKSSIVYKDFAWFNTHNVLPCAVCGDEVQYAFRDYGIQFDKHNGCKHD